MCLTLLVRVCLKTATAKIKTLKNMALKTARLVAITNLNGIVSQKTSLFLNAAVRTANSAL
jgi:hypothetical protein